MKLSVSQQAEVKGLKDQKWVLESLLIHGKKVIPTGGNLCYNSKKMKNMKKIYMIFAAAMLVLAAGCQGIEEGMNPDKQDAPSVESAEGFALYANIPATRTILDKEGFTLSWAENDQMAVFNAPAGMDQYSANLKFVAEDAANGKFTPDEGVVVPFEDGVNYDWYVCFPYRELRGESELVTPKGQSDADGYFPIGVTTQDGYNNSKHISSFDIMVGKAENTREPVIALKHLAVLQKFTVTNRSDKPIVITKLTFNGGDNKIFGAFHVDLTSDNPSISQDNAQSLYNERALIVKNGTELKVGESADFYMIMAPFTLNVGEVFKVTIETTTGTQVVEKTASEDIEFAAGTYNTANLVYDFVNLDYLYYDSFDGTVANNDKVDKSNTGMETSRWSSYDKGGLTVYDANIGNVKYAYIGKSTLSRYVNTSLAGMNDMYAWINNADGCGFVVSGIRLHGYTNLNLSYVQTMNTSKVKLEYSVNAGETWKEIGQTTVSNSTTKILNASLDFTVPSGSETISLRFTRLVQGPRIDNIKLTWQAQ